MDTSVCMVRPFAIHLKKIKILWGFPGGPVVRTQDFHCRGRASIPGQESEVSKATQPKKRKGKNKKLR